MRLSKNSIASILDKQRSNNPVIHYISDITKASDFEEALKCFNGRCIVSYGIEEVHEITANSDALVVGLGVLDNGKILAMERSLRIAKKRNIPVILDLREVNLSLYRRNTALSFLNRFSIDVVKGTEEEVQSLIKSQKRHISKYKDIKDEYRDFATKNNVFLIVNKDKYYITDGYSEFYIGESESNFRKKLNISDYYSAFLAQAISISDRREERFASIIISTLLISIAEENLEKKIDSADYIDINSLRNCFFKQIYEINEEKIDVLGKIKYEFKSKKAV